MTDQPKRPTLRDLAQELIDVVLQQTSGYSHGPGKVAAEKAHALRAALAAPEPVDPVPVVAWYELHPRGDDVHLLGWTDRETTKAKALVRRDKHLAAIAAKDAEIAALKNQVEALLNLDAEQQERVVNLRAEAAALHKACNEWAEAMRKTVAERDALAKDAEWRPIEAAPKDGTEVLVWRKDCGPFIASYTSPDAMPLTQDEIVAMDEESLFAPDWFSQWPQSQRMDGSETPTHWKPLPPPPINKESNPLPAWITASIAPSSSAGLSVNLGKESKT